MQSFKFHVSCLHIGCFMLKMLKLTCRDRCSTYDSAQQVSGSSFPSHQVEGKIKRKKSANAMRDKTEPEAAKKTLYLWQMLTVTGDFLRIQIYFLVQNICASTVKKKKSFKRETARMFCYCTQIKAAPWKKQTSHGLRLLFSNSPRQRVHQLETLLSRLTGCLVCISER